MKALYLMGECIALQTQPKAEHVTWLQTSALKHADPAYVACAALCLGYTDLLKSAIGPEHRLVMSHLKAHHMTQLVAFPMLQQHHC